ncbi:Adenosine 3'-phospho 5'-phosphosulfate transporter 1 [Eumeta japonica]|uniref:Adenosine 3'-phospho 5'-phosphosulfate transporter 1 n=1 Tax=Eumeta variegata TaxID=151549 RepID=A0A4C1ZXJ2_EUMVA|nr:Adenosine 3'-phospho 5'-phosphosulfate transporter 1 [Eumeta japonica]
MENGSVGRKEPTRYDVDRMARLAVASCVGSMWLLVRVYQALQRAYDQSGALMVTEYSWLFRLLLNCIGYATVLLPGFLLYKYLDKINYFDKPTNSTWVSKTLFTCFAEPGERLPETVRKDEEGAVAASARGEALQLAFCFTGLMGSYLVWGLLQEKIMTQSYTMPDGTLQRFRDSQFLVFVNRSAAFLVALVRLWCSHRPLRAAPLYKYSYCALTNVTSAWCQYEALKYVSFPTQVLSKSCKVIPVMAMGKFVSGNRYAPYEYITALLISVGMVLFMFGAADDYTSSTVTTMSGVLLLLLYMAADSFTSNWQGALFERYHATPMQMMCGVNLFSCILTGAALAQQSGSHASFALLSHPVFLVDCLLLSVSSTAGQLFIYYTIARFGAVVFTIIMTLRQAVSILVSCMVYGHRVSVGGAVGIIMVLTAVLLRLYCRQRLRRRRPRAPPPEAAPPSPVSVPLLEARS